MSDAIGNTAKLEGYWLNRAIDRGLIPQGSFFGATAPTAKGRGKVLQILSVSLDILKDEGGIQLTARNVSRVSGIPLANIQHYFSAHEDLLNGLLVYIGDMYEKIYSIILGNSGISSKEKLINLIRSQIDDCLNPDSTSLLFELWSICNRNPRLSHTMNSLYVWQEEQLQGLIVDIRPDISLNDAAVRAALMVAQIEGLPTVLRGQMNSYNMISELQSSAEIQLMNIALS